MAPQRNRRPGFSRRAQYGLFLSYVLASAGALIGAALLVLSLVNPGASAALRGAAREVTAPVASGLRWVRDGIGGIPRAIGDHWRVHGENRVLRAEVEQRARLVARARTLVRENARLKALLALRDRGATPVVTARLVASTASSTRRFGILNAGSRDGVRPGFPVRGPDGLIGRVLETSPNTARVLIVTDPESIVPARRARDGLPVIVVGRGDGTVEIRSASVANAPFLAGDVFVTSGTGGIYPPDVPVARAGRGARDVVVGRPFSNPDAQDYAMVLGAFLPPAVMAPGPAGGSSPVPAPTPAAQP